MRSTQRDIINNRNIQPIVQEIKDKMDLIPDNELIITLMDNIDEIKRDTAQFTKKDEDAEITGIFNFTTSPTIPTPTTNDNPVPLGFLTNLLDSYTKRDNAENISGAWYFQNGIKGKPGVSGNDYVTVSQVVLPSTDNLKFTGSNVEFTNPVKGTEAVRDNHFTTKSQVAVKGKESDTLHTTENIYNVYYHKTPAKTIVRDTPEDDDIITAKYVQNYVDASIPELSGYLSKNNTDTLQTVQGPIKFTKNITFDKNVTFGNNGTLTFNSPLTIPEGSNLKSVHFTDIKPFYVREGIEDPFITKSDLKNILTAYDDKITYTDDPENPRVYDDMDLVPKKYVYDTMEVFKYIPQNVAFRNEPNAFTKNNIFEKIPTILGTYEKDSEGHETYTFPTPITHPLDIGNKTAESSLITDHYLKNNYFDKSILNNQFLKFNGYNEEGDKKIDEVIDFKEGIKIKGAKISDAPSTAWDIIGKVLIAGGGLSVFIGASKWFIMKATYPTITNKNITNGASFNIIDLSTIDRLERGASASLLEGCQIPAVYEDKSDLKGFFTPFYSEQVMLSDGSNKLILNAGMGGFNYTNLEGWNAWSNDRYSKIMGPMTEVIYTTAIDKYPESFKSELMYLRPNYISLPPDDYIPNIMNMMTVQRLIGSVTEGQETFKYRYLQFDIGYEEQPIIYNGIAVINRYWDIQKAILHARLEPSKKSIPNSDRANYPLTSFSDLVLSIGTVSGKGKTNVARDFDLFKWAALYATQNADDLIYHNIGNLYNLQTHSPEMNVPTYVSIGTFQCEPARWVQDGVSTTFNTISGEGFYQSLTQKNTPYGDNKKNRKPDITYFSGDEIIDYKSDSNIFTDNPYRYSHTTITQNSGINTTHVKCKIIEHEHPWEWPKVIMSNMVANSEYQHVDVGPQNSWYQQYEIKSSINVINAKDANEPKLYEEIGAYFRFKENHYCDTYTSFSAPVLPFITEAFIGSFKAKEIMWPRIGELIALEYIFNTTGDFLDEATGIPNRDALLMEIGHIGIQEIDSMEIPPNNQYSSIIIKGWPKSIIGEKTSFVVNTTNQAGLIIAPLAKEAGPMPDDEEEINNNELTDEVITVKLLHNLGKNTKYSARAYYFLNDGTNTPIMGFSAVPDPCQNNLPLLQLEAADTLACSLDHQPKAKINCNLDVKENIRAKVPTPLPDIKNVDDNIVPVMAYLKPIAKNAKDAIDIAKPLEPFKDKANTLIDIANKLGSKTDKLANISDVLANPLTSGKTRIDTVKTVADIFLNNDKSSTFFDYFIKKMLDVGETKSVDILNNTLLTMAKEISIRGTDKYIFDVLSNQLKDIANALVKQNDTMTLIANKVGLSSPGVEKAEAETGIWKYVRTIGGAAVEVAKEFVFRWLGLKSDSKNNDTSLISIDESNYFKLVKAILFYKKIGWQIENDEQIPVYEDDDIIYKVGPVNLDSRNEDEPKEVATYVATNINLPDNEKFEVWSKRQKANNGSPLIAINNVVTTNGKNIIENNVAEVGTVLISRNEKQNTDDTDTEQFFATHAYVNSHGPFFKRTDKALYSAKQVAITPDGIEDENSSKTILTFPETITNGIQGGIALYNSTTKNKTQLRLKNYTVNGVEQSEPIFVAHDGLEHSFILKTYKVTDKAKQVLKTINDSAENYKIVRHEEELDFDEYVGKFRIYQYLVLSNGKRVRVNSEILEHINT